MDWVAQTQIYFLVVLEAVSPRPRFWPFWCLVSAPLRWAEVHLLLTWPFLAGVQEEES